MFKTVIYPFIVKQFGEVADFRYGIIIPDLDIAVELKDDPKTWSNKNIRRLALAKARDALHGLMESGKEFPASSSEESILERYPYDNGTHMVYDLAIAYDDGSPEPEVDDEYDLGFINQLQVTVTLQLGLKITYIHNSGDEDRAKAEAESMFACGSIINIDIQGVPRG